MTLGVSWSNQTSPNTNTWRSIVYADSLGIFLAVADGGGAGKCMTSPDGLTWTARTISSDNWGDVAWIPDIGLFVAVGNPQSNTAVSTSPDGTTWTVRSGATGANASCIAWAHSLGYMIVPIRGDATHVWKSVDGINWTKPAITGTFTSTAQRIIWDAGRSQFVAVSDGGVSATTGVFTSPDGIAWTPRTTPATYQLFAIAMNPAGDYVATALTGTGRALKSTDGGVTWASHTTADETAEWEGVCWDATDGVWIAVAVVAASAAKSIMTSPDGVTWTSVGSVPVNVNWRGVVYSAAKNMAVAVAESGTAAQRIATSTSVTGGSVGSVSAAATVTGHGNAVKKSVVAAAGQATVAGHSGATKQAVGSASGHATATGISNIVHTGAGQVLRQPTVQGVSAATKDSVFTINGHATAHGAGFATETVQSVGTVAGRAAVSGKSNNDKDAVGAAAGHATVLGVGSSVIHLKGAGQLFVLGYAQASYDIFLRAVGLSLVAGDEKRVANARGIPLVSLKAQQSKTSLKANVQE
jgi:hypothetical protein